MDSEFPGEGVAPPFKSQSRDDGKVVPVMSKEPVTCSPPEVCANFEALNLHPNYNVFDMNLFDSDMMHQNLKLYFQCCKEQTGLMVTTSCFSVWREAKKTNGAAKVIPAVPATGLNEEGPNMYRVFFFDDNINLHLGGSFDAEGICNLRDVNSGEFVDFSIGKNGFAAERFFRHTVVHHSDEYRNVLVQANIVDAIANPDYFTSIIHSYAKPGEKLLVFADVNGTVVWDDTVRGKGAGEVLLGTMFRFAEVRPGPEGFAFGWEDKPPVLVEKNEDLRGLVNRISNKDNDFYQRFWTLATCREFLDKLSQSAKIGWLRNDDTTFPAAFFTAYDQNLEEIKKHALVDGIPESWFTCYDYLLNAGHTVVLNSFGVDTFRVMTRVVPDVRNVLQLTVNFKRWGQKDVDLWLAQFKT